MKDYKNIILILFFIMGSCTLKNDLVKNGNHRDAIENAITDFLQKNKLTESDNVFCIDIHDINDDILEVGIKAEKNKLLPSAKNKIGTNYPYFPTNYLEKNEKLFYWYDSTKVITKEIVIILNKYDQIDSLNVNGFVGIPLTSSLIDESQKTMHYYFCKNNLSKYKKVYTNKTLDDIKIPELNCTNN